MVFLHRGATLKAWVWTKIVWLYAQSPCGAAAQRSVAEVVGQVRGDPSRETARAAYSTTDPKGGFARVTGLDWDQNPDASDGSSCQRSAIFTVGQLCNCSRLRIDGDGCRAA